MPKLKTHKGAAKRFKATKSGKFLHKKAHRRHILTSKPAKRKRHLRGSKLVDAGDELKIRHMLPYA